MLYKPEGVQCFETECFSEHCHKLIPILLSCAGISRLADGMGRFIFCGNHPVFSQSFVFLVPADRKNRTKTVPDDSGLLKKVWVETYLSGRSVPSFMISMYRV